ncbi:hypothetical protein FACS1894217_08610 [Clostridia bacterium]|nr:hypothetical protein FACS1894217_08610 [Clostridia bacterium]
MTFSSVVGQAHVTETLRAQVAAGRLSHAYLFTGTRGTGKTTCAKILARAANCLSPVNGNPCNHCAFCLGMLDGSLTDVLEIDAASNSGVDNIRSLRDETAYSPVGAKMRVYIIDEVHMLSAGAFNALLKTLEEPPSYVLFILATTETHKVPATILSRCQRFAFRRLSEADLAALLSETAARENVNLTHDAAALIAKLADGAARDALSLLDQCGNAEPGWTLDAAAVRAALGLAGGNAIEIWLDLLKAHDADGAIRFFHEQLDAGREVASLLGELAGVLRDQLLDNIAGGANRELLSMLDKVQDTLGKLPRAPRPRIEAELGILKLCVGDAPAAPVVVAEKPKIAATAPVVVEAPVPEIPKPVVVPAPTAEAPPPAVGTDWETIRKAAAAELPVMSRAFLNRADAQLVKSEGMWQIKVADDFTRKQLSDKQIVAALEKAAGVNIRVVLAQVPMDANPKVQDLLNNWRN